MDEALLQWVFLASLAASLLLGLLWPLREPALSRGFRWANNGLLFLINGLLVRLLVPGGLLAVAYWAQQQSWGLLHLLAPPPWLAVGLGVLVLDLGGYSLHRLSHRFGWLWRLHRLHHSDIDVDVTTELRHHPLEVLVTLGVQALLVLLAGLPPLAVMLYILLIIPVSLLSHGNWLLPARLDRPVRTLLVTPAMHRIHHSAWQPETDSNYGMLFSWWDRLFASYRATPRQAYRDMCLGLERYRDPQEQILHRLLLNPLE